MGIGEGGVDGTDGWCVGEDLHLESTRLHAAGVSQSLHLFRDISCSRLGSPANIHCPLLSGIAIVEGDDFCTRAESTGHDNFNARIVTGELNQVGL